MIRSRNQIYIAQTGSSAWRILVFTFILGWFCGIATVALMAVYAHPALKAETLLRETRVELEPRLVPFLNAGFREGRSGEEYSR